MNTTTQDGDGISSPSAEPSADERYRAFIENSAEGIWRFETHKPISIRLPVEEQISAIFREGYLAECNNTCARMYGFDNADQLIGAALRDFLSPDEPANHEYLQSFIQSGYRLTEAVSVEADREGSTHYFSNSLVGMIDNGYLFRAWGTQRDITAQRKAEDALRESEQRFRFLADSAPVLIWMSDTNGGGDWFNRPWLNFTGRTMEQETGSGWIEGIHRDDRTRFLEAYRAAVEARESFSIEYRLRRADGEYRWVLDSGKPRFAEKDGHSFLGYIGSCVDISLQKEAEAQLSIVIEQQGKLLVQQRDFLKDVLRATTDGVFYLCDTNNELPAMLPLSLFSEGEETFISAPNLSVFRRIVQAAAVEVGLTLEQQNDLVTAVGEASMNIVVHATRKTGTGQVRSDRAQGIVQVWLYDDGPGIPVRQLHRAVLERGFTTAGSLGHGFFLLLKSADRIYLLTDSDIGTTMVIEKWRIPEEPEWLKRTRLGAAAKKREDGPGGTRTPDTRFRRPML